ncbi:hypothetical protein [Methanoregula sp. PtaB.Bin085]|uniref:hypothetical protein n=1 Tax=Methanoregula sp. PtaB.Bin085 TaxID=1811680 RepID=UPI0025CCA945|nr:hypothetical protein [Methanoregula sp. PtaB.Bin085]
MQNCLEKRKESAAVITALAGTIVHAIVCVVPVNGLIATTVAGIAWRPVFRISMPSAGSSRSSWLLRTACHLRCR